MSGLIWGGIGQGIVNAGQAIGGMMMKDIEYNRQLESEERKEANYLKRLEEAQRIKDDAAEAKAEALNQRVIKETAAAQTAGAEVPAARRLTELRAKAGPGEGEDALPDEVLKKLLKDDPSLRKSYEESGLITKKNESLERAEGAIASAMAAGASSTTIKNLQALRTATLDEIKQTYKEEQDTKKWEQQTTQNEAMNKRLELLAQDVKTRERNADTYASRPTGGGGKGGGSDKDPIFKTITGNDGIEYGIRRSGEKVPLGESSKFNDQISKDIQRMAKNDPKFAKLEPADQRERALALRTPAAPAAEPAAAETVPPKPNLANVKGGVPAGSAVGSYVAGRGWEVKDKSGKVFAYVGK